MNIVLRNGGSGHWGNVFAGYNLEGGFGGADAWHELDVLIDGKCCNTFRALNSGFEYEPYDATLHRTRSERVVLDIVKRSSVEAQAAFEHIRKPVEDEVFEEAGKQHPDDHDAYSEHIQEHLQRGLAESFAQWLDAMNYVFREEIGTYRDAVWVAHRLQPVQGAEHAVEFEAARALSRTLGARTNKVFLHRVGGRWTVVAAAEMRP